MPERRLFGRPLRPARRELVLVSTVSILCSLACARTRPVLVVKAARSSQGVFPKVLCQIDERGRSEHGLPLMNVEIETTCLTSPKVLLAVFDEQHTITQTIIKRALTPHRAARLDAELPEVSPRGTELTVFVWSRCQNGETIQGADTCEMPP